MDAIECVLSTIFPTMADEKRQEVVKVLMSAGVQDKADLAFVEADDLTNCLPPIQVRKFLASVRDTIGSSSINSLEEACVNSSSQRFSTPRSVNSSSQSSLTSAISNDSSKLEFSPVSTSSEWISSFCVPWNKFPESAKEAINDKVAPSSSDMRQIATLVISEVFSYTRKPSRKQLRAIAQKIVAKAPSSFADIINGKIVGDGIESLMLKLESKKENFNRNHSFSERNKSKCGEQHSAEMETVDDASSSSTNSKTCMSSITNTEDKNSTTANCKNTIIDYPTESFQIMANQPEENNAVVAGHNDHNGNKTNQLEDQTENNEKHGNINSPTKRKQTTKYNAVEWDCSQKQTKRKSAESGTAEAKKSKSTKNSYGCVQWELAFTTSEEKSMEFGMTRLVEEYKKVQRNFELVSKIMKDCYPLQRKQINNNPVTEVFTNWPFLHEEEFLFEHFKLLMGFSVESNLIKSIGEKTEHYYDFMEKKGSKRQKVAKVLQEMKQLQSSKQDAIVLLILAYMDDETTQLARMVEVC